MADERVFDHLVEGLMRGLGPGLTPALRDKWRGAGVDPDRRIPSTIARAQWVSVLRHSALLTFPVVPEDEAYRRLGRKLIDGYQQTLLGRAVLSLVRVLGPRRTLVRLTDQFRSGNTYSQTRLTEKGPNDYELWVNQANGNPGYIQGILDASLAIAGARGLSIEVVSFDGDAVVYRIRWS